ncbi:hypothetical protein [Phormidesmis priestleyi]
MENILFSPHEFEIVIDRIISSKRKNDTARQNEKITDQERQQIIHEALKVYEKFCDLRRRENVSEEAKVYIEYKQGLTKMTEEIDPLF